METLNTRLPKDFKFEVGKSYSLKYRRTEWRYTYLQDSDMYKWEHISMGKIQRVSYLINKDIPGNMDYILSFAEGKGTIKEFVPEVEVQ